MLSNLVPISAALDTVYHGALCGRLSSLGFCGITFSLTLLVIVIAQPPFAQVLMSSNQTCKNLEAYLVPRGLSADQVPGEEGTKDSDSPLGDSFFSGCYFSHGHSAFLWKTCETWSLQVSFLNDENADQIESMGVSKEKRIRELYIASF